MFKTLNVRGVKTLKLKNLIQLFNTWSEDVVRLVQIISTTLLTLKKIHLITAKFLGRY